MKRNLCIIVVLFVVLLLCAGCYNNVPAKPVDSTLEFWIAEDVSSVDFSEYHEILGWFGAREFYGKGYAPVDYVDQDGNVYWGDPQYCVKYVVGAYPDESSGGQFITQITITDPNVTIYGITCNSSFAEFDVALRQVGYSIEETSTVSLSAALGKVSIALTKTDDFNQIFIRVQVTNKTGIVY